MKSLEHLSDEEVLLAADIAAEDLRKAADEERNSDWHDCCFAAVCVLGQEMARRRISFNKTH